MIWLKDLKKIFSLSFSVFFLTFTRTDTMEAVFTHKDKDAAYKYFVGQRPELSTVTLDKDGEVREMLDDVLDMVAERKVYEDVRRFWNTFMLVVKPDAELRQKLFHLKQLLDTSGYRGSIYPDLLKFESSDPELYKLKSDRMPFAWVMDSFEEELYDFDRGEAGTINENFKRYWELRSEEVSKDSDEALPKKKKQKKTK